MFPALDGNHSIRDALRAQLAGLPLGGPDRDRRLKAMCEPLLQLDMWGLLEVQAGPAPPAFTGHPLLEVFARAVLGALKGRSARLYVETDWLGESVWVRMLVDNELHWIRLMDQQHTGTQGWIQTGQTALLWAKNQQGWFDTFAEKTAKRLTRLQAAGDWDAVAALAGAGIQFEVRPDAPLQVHPL